MPVDVVGIVEATYRIEQHGPSWIGGILEHLAPWLDDGLGLFGFAYSSAFGGGVTPGVFGALGCSPEALSVLPAAATWHSPAFVRATYVESDLAIASQSPDWSESNGARYALQGGVADVWGINGRNAGQKGCTLFVNRRRAGAPTKAVRLLLTRIALHVAAAHRLRERTGITDATSRAEAILAADGRIEHVSGPAKPPAARNVLFEAVRTLDRARGKERRRDPHDALDTWKGLVAARWTLIDHFESDGRRYVLAQENEPVPQPLATLSTRERQVVANAALGRSNKEIAYALGLAHSTVRVLLTRAAKKVGASTRAQLVERFTELSRDANLSAD